MPNARTPKRWPYKAAKPARTTRVVKTKEPERGVHRRTAPEPAWRITRLQARIAFFGALFVLVGSAGWWAYHSPYLTVSNVEVAGTSEVPPSDVVKASGIDGSSIFGLDIAAAEARIEELPKVFDATIEKHGWTSVTIHVEERTAWGNWRIDGVDVPIDIDGYVLDGPPAAEGAPTILEVDPQRALNKGDRLDPGAVQLAARLVDESETTLGRRVLVLAYRQESGLTVAFSSPEINGDPIWVTFGDSRDYDYKIASLYVLLEQAKERDLALNAVDLRFGDRLSFN